MASASGAPPPPAATELVIARFNEDLSWVPAWHRGLLPRGRDGGPELFESILIYNKGPAAVEPAVLAALAEGGAVRVRETRELPNVGRESHTYLHHLAERHAELAGVTVFMMGSAYCCGHKQVAATAVARAALSRRRSAFPIQRWTPTLRLHAGFSLDSWCCTEAGNAAANPETRLELCALRPFGVWFRAAFPHADAVMGESWYGGAFAVSAADARAAGRGPDDYRALRRWVQGHSNPECGHFMERAWLAAFYPQSNDPANVLLPGPGGPLAPVTA